MRCHAESDPARRGVNETPLRTFSIAIGGSNKGDQVFFPSFSLTSSLFFSTSSSLSAQLQQAKSTVAETVTNAPVVDLSGAKDINDAELVSVGKPLAASFGSALPEAKAQIAKTFSVEHLTPPRSPTMHQLPDVPENTRPVSPSVMVNLDLTKPLPAYTRGESKMSTLSRAESKPPVVAQALPDATSAPAVAEAPASEENP